jgi:uncharacterized protein YbjQ (UPF0145 family)
MSAATPAGPSPDLRAEVRRATAALGATGHDHGRPVTSDLSIDEALLLHAVGWEPVDLVCGVSVTSVPSGVWNWGAGEIVAASQAQGLAFTGAANRIAEECGRAGGHGVVGVHVEATVERHHVDVELVGTAVRPVGAAAKSDVFVSDLSGRDFSLLRQAGWIPVGLAYGASFVYAPRRSAGTSLRQTRENVELANFTEAMYSARELAMERMQQTAITMGGKGIVEVKVTEGPMPFAHHAIGFAAWGTAVRLEAETHQYLRPRVVLPLDDAVVEFEAESLRGQ